MLGDQLHQRAELTCKQWFEYGQRSRLPHSKSELMAAASAAVTATFDTIVDQHHRLRARRRAPPVTRLISRSVARAPANVTSLIPPAGDWLTPVSELLYRLDVRGTLKTDDGELVLVEYGGVISTSKEAFDRFAKGEVIAAKDMYFMTAPRFSPSSKNMIGSTTSRRLAKWSASKAVKA